jgi:hypothetical protein
MTTYDVYFRNDLQWGTREFIADTPEQALELARRFAADHADELIFEIYEGSDFAINEIEVCDVEHNSLATWFDDEMRLRLAARDLLDASQQVLDRWQRGDLAEAVRALAAAVAKAKGGAQ